MYALLVERNGFGVQVIFMANITLELVNYKEKYYQKKLLRDTVYSNQL